ncbi:unnamed protein product [Absidia cylindrospora]
MDNNRNNTYLIGGQDDADRSSSNNDIGRWNDSETEWTIGDLNVADELKAFRYKSITMNNRQETLNTSESCHSIPSSPLSMTSYHPSPSTWATPITNSFPLSSQASPTTGPLCHQTTLSHTLAFETLDWTAPSMDPKAFRHRIYKQSLKAEFFATDNISLRPIGNSFEPNNLGQQLDKMDGLLILGGHPPLASPA